ncbi:hypothetical protein GCM10010924_12100 [Rhizobium wenxiniae]|nr:hypothetical protein GCM10010924_12100 [Rhizobium wenxiniae]
MLWGERDSRSQRRSNNCQADEHGCVKPIERDQSKKPHGEKFNYWLGVRSPPQKKAADNEENCRSDTVQINLAQGVKIFKSTKMTVDDEQGSNRSQIVQKYNHYTPTSIAQQQRKSDARLKDA